MNRQTMLRTTRWLLVLFVIGICGRGYGIYSQVLKAKPDAWMDIVQGTASAPEQYRIGVVMVAYWVTQHLHGVGLGVVFWAFDVMSGCAAALLLYQLLVRSAVFERATLQMQWFGSAGFVALMLYLVDWLNWYQRVSTLPTALLVSVMLWLWTPRRESDSSHAQQAGIAGAFVLLVVMQSFIRADVALMVCSGLLLFSVAGMTGRLALPRVTTLAVAGLGGVVTLGVQFYLVKVRYPQASYGDVPVVMLVHEWRHPVNFVTAVIFLAPFLWTLREATRVRFRELGTGGAFLLAGVGYAALWLVMGRVDEVRIFLPMAMVITPLTVELAMQRLDQSIDMPA